MNTNGSKSDEPLDKRLQEWRVNAPLPPRFQEQVWHRIEQAEITGTANPWRFLQDLLAGLFARRGWATSYVALALVVGLTFGYWHARREETSMLTAGLGRQYMQSVDPYQKQRH